MKKITNFKTGFTLIEMLAVMFIIAIIFSIVLPAFGPIMSTMKLNTASENLANAIESARQYAMTKGNEVYVLFPISTNTDADYRAYKIYNPDSKNPSPSPHTVGKLEYLPVGIRINTYNSVPSSTALRGADISEPFPEDTDGDASLKYLICETSGSVICGGAIGGGNSSIVLFYDVDGNSAFDRTNDKNLFREIVVYNIPQGVTIKDIGVQ